MKSRRRRSTSSEESGGSAATAESESEVSSGSEASDSASSEPAPRHKKHKHRTASSASDSQEESRRRAKKRKHKKKKKKHGKKRRRDESDGEDSSDSELDERKRRHKHKNKHTKSTSRSPSVQEVPVSRSVRDASPMVRARHSSSRDRSVSVHPPHRYYESYPRPESRSESEGRVSRRDEAERFYRGSSRERSVQRYRHSGYEEPERYEGHSRAAEYDSRSRREPPHYQHDYRQRAPRYEQEEVYRDRPHREREYRREDIRPQHTRGPVCLVCGETHAGRACRGLPPARVRRYDREHADNGDERRPVKRERERYEPRREERVERRRTSRERSYEKERSQDASPRPRRHREEARVPREEYRRSPEHRDSKRSFEKRDERREEPREERKRELERREERKRDDREKKDSPRRNERRSRFEEDDGKTYSWGKTEVKKETAPVEKDKPNFGLSGKLAADTNTVNGIVLKYSEPQDAKQPKRRWRFYPFKGDKALSILYIHRQSCFILGREHRAVDIPLEHPSISKQHAALQYRATPFTRPDGTQARRVRPYIIDLDSANGTFVNNKKIEPRRYVELLERDVVKFGFSQREYVLLHENSKDDAADDDQEMGPAGGAGPGEELGSGVTSIAAVKRERQIKKERDEDGE